MAPQAISSRCVIPGFDFDAETDLDQSPAWFLDATTPFPLDAAVRLVLDRPLPARDAVRRREALAANHEGMGLALQERRGYLTLLLVKSEEERREREQRFRLAIRPFIEDYDGLWCGFVKEMLGHYDGLKKLDLERATQMSSSTTSSGASTCAGACGRSTCT